MREWITGRQPIYETLRAARRQAARLWVAQNTEEKARIADILHLAEKKQIPIERVPRSRLDPLAQNHQGVALQTSGYPYETLPDILEFASQSGEPPFLLLLDTLQDPQNLGTLLRTAEAVGIHGVLLPLRRTATVTPAVVSASSGASEHLRIAQVNLAQAIQTLKQADVWVVGLEGSESAQPPQHMRLDGALALVVGSEGQGMRSLVMQSCDFLMQLPMRGKIESLNAAVAGSIALYLAWQSRGFSLKTIDARHES